MFLTSNHLSHLPVEAMGLTEKEHPQDHLFVHSYLIDFAYLNQHKRIAYLTFLLIKQNDTYLCQYNFPIVVDISELKDVSIRNFLQQIPVPFEDEVIVEPCVLSTSKLNRITKIESTGNKLQLDYHDYYTEVDLTRTGLKPSVKDDHGRWSSQNDLSPMTEFIKSKVDFSYKQAVRRYIHTNYLKGIPLKQDKEIYVPRLAAFSIIMHGDETIVKHIFEGESPFLICTNHPKMEIILRQISFLPKFSYSSVYANNKSKVTIIQDEYFLYSKNGSTVIFSNKGEVLDTCHNAVCLQNRLMNIKPTVRPVFQTNSVKLRRKLHKQFNIKRILFLAKKQRAYFNRILNISRNRYFTRQKFLLKKGVVVFDQRKLSSSNDSTLYIHDFKNYCASTINRYTDDNGIRNVFTRLVRSRSDIPELKAIIATLFGMAKYHYPEMFYQTTNDMIYVMYRTYSANRKHVLGMCRDSFFTYKKSMKLPVSLYRLHTECKLRSWIIKNATTFIGVDQGTDDTVVKGIHFPPFHACYKIVNCIYKHLSQRQINEKINVPQLIEKSASLTEDDFTIHIKKPLKASDYCYYGVNSNIQYVYSLASLENPVFHVRAAEPTLNIRPKNLCGEIDFNMYRDQIMNCIISFAKTFQLTHIINETVLCETDLFLKPFIQQSIFHKSKQCHLPMFQLPECQL